MDEYLEGELSISKNSSLKIITLCINDNEKIILNNVSFRPIGYERVSILDGEDNVEKTLPLRLESYSISPLSTFSDNFDVHKLLPRLDIITSWSFKFIAVTEGGWLPVGITQANSHYLLDKNIYNMINSRFAVGKDIKNDFFDLIKDENPIFNPALFMLEGNTQSFDRAEEELESKYFEAIGIINRNLKNVIIPCDSKSLVQSTASMLKQLYSNNNYKLKFIQSVIIILYKETAVKKRKEVIEKLKELAIQNNIKRNSILFIAAICAALGHPGNNPAKKIFKPKPPKQYTLKNAYNALSDFRALDYLMWAIVLNPNKKTYLCTNDKNLVKFWCAIEPSNFKFENNALSHSLKFRWSLFNHLNDNEFELILQAINS